MTEWQVSPVPRPAASPGAVPPAAMPPTAMPPTAAVNGTLRRDSDPPLQDVLVELWQNVEKLMRQEVALARAELEAKATKLKAELIASATGAVLVLVSVLALIASVILLLSEVMPPWLAALVTSGATAGVGYLMLKKGQPSAADVTPERTLESVKKDIQTFREAVK